MALNDWAEEKHPRDGQGRFTSGGGLGSWAARRAGRMAGPLFRKAEKEGGFSVKPGASKEERSPKSGYMVSRAPEEGLGHVIEIAKMADRDPPPTAAEVRAEVTSRVKDWLKTSLPAVEGKGDHYLGGWFERGSDGSAVALHLDVSQRFTDREKAVQTGRERNQLAIWHVDKSEEIATGGTGR